MKSWRHLSKLSIVLTARIAITPKALRFALLPDLVHIPHGLQLPAVEVHRGALLAPAGAFVFVPCLPTEVARLSDFVAVRGQAIPEVP